MPVHLVEVVEQQSNSEPLPCAWCMVENGEPLGNGSHGICREHAEREYAKFVEAKREKRAA